MSEEKLAYPVNIRGDLSSPPSRGWWLLKWLLGIPHYVVLFFLAIAFAVVWVISLFAILFTGKYPKGLFDFNVGVLRWGWRVSFYSYSALATDKYPPHSLNPDPNYPADLEVEYPEKLSRGLVLVKWWLLAIPHYLIISIFEGLYRYSYQISGTNMKSEWGIGLIGIMVLISAIVLLFNGKYPGSLFKLVMGMNRWSIRVWAYSSLMTDKYPPFRLWDE